MREEPKLFGSQGRPEPRLTKDVNLLDVEPEAEDVYEEEPIDEVYEDDDGERRRIPFKVLAAVAIIAAIGAGALGAAMFLGVTETAREPVDVPLMTADPTPYRERPEDPGGLEVPYQDIEVLEAMDEDEAGGENFEVLLPDPEEPMAPSEVAEAETIEPEIPVIDIEDTTAGGDIVIEDTQGELVGTDTEAQTVDIASSLPVPPLPPAAPAKPGVATGSVTTQETTEPSSTDTGGELSFDDVAASLGGDGAQASAPSASAVGGTKIQIASFGSEAKAMEAWTSLQARFRDILGAYQPVIDEAVLSNGTFYRLQVGPFASDTEARSVCDSLKVRQVECIIVAP
ncbi:MAG: SPOR domain-containing protein [Pseudomonadota bacterium]